MNLMTFADREELTRAAAEDFVARAELALRQSGRFTVALAGGSTPEATYRLLAEEYADREFWSRTHFFFGDERTVAPEHEDSNYRMARESLLDHVSTGSVHRMRGEAEPGAAADSYEEELREFFGAEREIEEIEALPQLDLVMLGLGEDGHTASLFPHTQALEVRDRLVVSNEVPKLETVRLTLTVPMINAARSVVFTAAGGGKAEALKRILAPDADPRDYPARLILPDDGELVWMVDAEAGNSLEET